MSAEKLLQILEGPHMSEKTARMTEKENAYVFKVDTGATKSEIKQAVEKLFDTKVEAVRVVNVKPKKRIFRGMLGTRKKWKKAYVTLREKHKIELFEGNQ